MLSLVVLISGTGSNLRSLLETSEDAEFPARVVAVGADRDADGFEHAEEFGIPTFSVALSSFADRDAWGDALLEQIELWNPDLVILSGFMKLLPTRVVDALSPRLWNTHPAYLPEFPGAHAVRDALAAGASETGASVIVVAVSASLSGPDGGRHKRPRAATCMASASSGWATCQTWCTPSAGRARRFRMRNR